MTATTPDACPHSRLQAPWDALAGHVRHGLPSLPGLFAADPGRATRYRARGGPLLLDYSRQPVDDAVLQHLAGLAAAAGCQQALAALHAGAEVNNTERRAATHTRLRDPSASCEQAAARARWAFADRVRSGDYRTPKGEAITDVVNIGIGGSHLGPALAVDALAHGIPRCHFLSNVDPEGLARLLPQLPPRSTLWILSSKSFSTQETLLNADAVCEWMDRKAAPGWREHQLAAVTANAAAARVRGISDALTFGLDDSVGGRYSIWSAVDLPLAIALGSEAMQAFHRGAHALDCHALEAPTSANLPLLMALLGIWNRNFLQRPTQAVVAYDNRLELLPDYLQQLVMESNGKQVQRDGRPVACATSPVLWGGIGTNGQHSFHQCLHQGTDAVPVDFLVPASGQQPQAQHDVLVAHALAQAHTLAFGSASPLATPPADPALQAHRHMPGNRPSNLLLYSRLCPETLGALIALYEHKTFFESVIWGINPFDQWGVELGKRISQAVQPALQGGDPALTADLRASIDSLLSLRSPS